MAYDPQKLRKIEDTLNVTAQLIGPIQSKPNDNGIIEGLGLLNEAESCVNSSRTVREGIYKVGVFGTWATGKTTIINALIGNRVLPEAPTPSTAIVSHVRFGNDNKVHVRFNDGQADEVLSHNDFFNKYKFTKEDAVEAKSTGKVARFGNVVDSVVYSNLQLFENGVQVLDTSGLEDKACATEIALKTVNNSNAILYTGSVLSGGFNSHDVDFFQRNFDKKHLTNVFFLINKSDIYEISELQDVRDYFKEQLRDAFTDENDKFDQQLYDKRVFFISAKYALEYKLGEHSTRYCERDLPEFLRFEKELEGFLTSDERSKATFTSCFSKLANAYNIIQHMVDVNMITQSNLETTVVDDYITHSERAIEKTQNEYAYLRKSFNLAIEKTQSVIYAALLNAVDEIDNTYDAEIEDIAAGIDFGVIAYMALDSVKFWKSKEEKEQKFMEAIFPITSVVNNHIESKFRETIDSVPQLLMQIFSELRSDTNIVESNTNNYFEDLYTSINESGINPIQIRLTKSNINEKCCTTNDWIVENNIFSIRSLLYFIESTFSVTHFSPISTIAIQSLVHFHAGAKSINSIIIDCSKRHIVKTLRYHISEKKNNIDAIIREMYQTSFSNITKKIEDRILFEQQLIVSTKLRLKDQQFDYQKEINRCIYIQNRVFEMAKEAHEIIFKKSLTHDEFIKFSML